MAEFIDTNFMTLTRFILNEQRKSSGSSGEFTQLLNSIQCAIKSIASAVRKAGVASLYGITGSINDKGEQVKKLDMLANDLFINMLVSSYATCLLVSEENPKCYVIKKQNRGKYIVCFDPIDGSSNIDCMGTIGSIFSIFCKESDDKATEFDTLRPRREISDVTDEKPTESDALRSGRQIIAAGYAIYGSSTAIVLSLNYCVNCFTLDPGIGEFVLTDSNIKIPRQGNIYSINEGYTAQWEKGYIDYVQMRKDPSKGKINISRYTGCMVADIHRTIKYGGIYLYPATKLSPHGKLNLLYQCIPMAYIVTCAGGSASNGKVNILDIQPSEIHQRSPMIVGSKRDVEEVLTYVRKENADLIRSDFNLKNDYNVKSDFQI